MATAQAEEIKIWERLETETDKAWTAFRIYRDLPPQERSLVQAFVEFREITGSPVAERPNAAPGYFFGWSAKYDWGARVLAFDRFQDSRALAEAEIDHIAKLNSYRARLLGYAEISTNNGIRAMKMIERSLKALEEGEDSIPLYHLPKFIQATAKLFETAAEQEGKALAVDRLLEIVAADEGSKLH